MDDQVTPTGEGDPIPTDEGVIELSPWVEGNDRVPKDAEVLIAQGEATPADDPEGEDD